MVMATPATMNKHALFTAITIVSFSHGAHAAIENAWWNQGSSDGAVSVSTQGSGYNSGTDTLSLTGKQNWGGTLSGTIVTSSPTDPILFEGSQINNDTTFAWQSYRVNVYMANTFTLGGEMLSAPPGWTLQSAQSTPTLVASGPFTGQYEASMVFSGATPLAMGGEIEFFYNVTFTGSTSGQNSFSQEMIPQAAVPEASPYWGVVGLAMTWAHRRFGSVVKRLAFA